MKKLSLLLLLAVIFTTIFSANVSGAYKVGDKLGNVLNTDIKTYINGEQIPCYNIGGNSVVVLADLRNYGFDVSYNDQTRTSTVTRNYDKKSTPITNIANNTKKPGTVAFSYLYTDIVAKINGAVVESFNVQGNLAIYFSALKDYGTFEWDSKARTSKLTLYGKIIDTSNLYDNPVAGEPVKLKDLDYFDNFKWNYRPNIERRANTGDLYNDCYHFSANYNGYSYRASRDYLINKQYSYIQGTVIVEYDGRASEGEFILKIYGDDVLLYESDSIVSGTNPFNFRVNLKNINVMIIRVKCTGNNNSNLCISLSDVTLYK